MWLEMSELKNVLVVYGDFRSFETVWTNDEIELKELSANARRRARGMGFVQCFRSLVVAKET
jgi:hypothetical protein